MSPSGLIAFNATTSGTSAINGIWTLPLPEPGGAWMLFVAVNGTLLAAVVRRRPKRI